MKIIGLVCLSVCLVACASAPKPYQVGKGVYPPTATTAPADAKTIPVILDASGCLAYSSESVASHVIDPALAKAITDHRAEQAIHVKASRRSGLQFVDFLFTLGIFGCSYWDLSADLVSG
jgi:hypothetical protein